MALAVGMVLIGFGVVALATNFVWDGDGLLPEVGAPALWMQADQWVQNSGHPNNSNDNATLADVVPSATSTFNRTSATTINNLDIAGSSPTKMTLHLRDAALTVANLDLDDYSQLDLDYDFTVNGVTTMYREIWVDVASSKICDFEDVDVTYSATHLHATTSGTLRANEVTIDTEADAAQRGLLFSGGTWEIDNKLTLRAEQGDAGTNKAALWLVAGTMNIVIGGSAKGLLEIDGGDHLDRKVGLDIDGTLTAEETQFLGDAEDAGDASYVTIDVASNLTAKGGDVIFKAGAIVSKSGSGTFRSGT